MIMASPQGQPPQKTMSSRLMTMKFMQRASATSPRKDESADVQPSHKRQKIAHRPARSRDSDRPKYELLADEDSRRNEALERQAEEAGDSMWTIHSEAVAPPTVRYDFQVVQAGYGEIDSQRLLLVNRNGSENGSEHETSQAPPETPSNALGRRSFGDFGKEKQKRRESDSEGEDASEEGSESKSDDSGGVSTPRKAGAKRARRSDADDRQDKDKKVKLSSLTSISGGGGSRNVQGAAKDVVCFKCGKKGHRKADCPLLARPRRGNG